MLRSLSFRKNPLFWQVAIVGVIFDQLTKFWVSQAMAPVGNSWPLWSGVFHFTYVLNTGAAFSFFQGGASWLKWFSLAVSGGLMISGGLVPFRRLEQLGYGFVLAGAVGNGIDRFLFGYVIDFLDFRLINFPVFNLADVSINLGLATLIWANFQPHHPRQTKD